MTRPLRTRTPDRRTAHPDSDAARSAGAIRSSRGLAGALAVAAGCLVHTAPADAAAPVAAPPAAPGAGTPEAALPGQAACLDAHTKAQMLKLDDKYLAAYEQLLVCSSATCPGVVIADCGSWLQDLENKIPSVAFTVTLDGKEAPDAHVLLDGKPVKDQTHALRVDPGRHTVSAELGALPSQQRTIFARAGEPAQLVNFAFQSPKPEAPKPLGPVAPTRDAPPSRPIPIAVYPLLGASVAGFASFGVFSLIGKSRQHELEQKCAPGCSSSDLRPMKTAYLIGDVSLGVGAAALVSAAVLYMTRPAERPPSTPSYSLRIDSPTGDASALGLSATRTW